MSDIKYIAQRLQQYNDDKQEPVHGRVNGIEGSVAVLATNKGLRRKFYKTPVNVGDQVLIDGEFCQKVQKQSENNIIWV